MKNNFFIDRPIFSIALAVVILLLGVLGYNGLAVEQLPDVAPPVVEVSADYAGASAEAVQRSVIIPIEEAVNGVDGINEVLSTSTSSGNASITITFKPGTDPDMATVLVKNRLGEVEGILPHEVVETGVHVGKEKRGYLRILALESPDGRYDNDFITNFFDINISPRLQRIKGVGNIELLGSVYAMRIWLDPMKMATYSLEPKDIEEVLEAQNIEAAIGTLGEDSKNTFQYTMVYRGRLLDPEEFGNIVLRSEPKGDDLLLSDVARCEVGRENYSSNSWVNSHPGTVAIITQAHGSNAQEVNHEIDKLIEESMEKMPPGLVFRSLLDTNDFLDVSMKEVYTTLFEAIILVVLVVLLFLQNVRATLIPALAIVVSLVGTFAFMYVVGFTLNLITLFALVLVIGTVVDDAIVVVEAVQSQFEAGCHDPYRATTTAMREISNSVIITTIVFMFVFIPISFVSGLVGTYYRQFGLTMAVAVAISTLNALSLSPALCVLMMKPGVESKNRIYKAFNASYHAIARKYQDSVSLFVKQKWLAVVAPVAVFILLVALVNTVPTSLIPDEDTGNVFVDISTPPGSTLEQTKKAVLRASDKVADIDEIENCASVAGWNILGGDGANAGMLIMKLKHWDERSGSDHDIDAVVEQIEQRMDSIKSANMFTFAMPTVTGYGFSNSIELFVQDYNSLSIEKLKSVTDRFAEALTEREEIGEAYSSYEVNYPQYNVSVNASICKRYGVETSDVLGVLNGYIGSNYATQFNAFGRLYHVMMQADPELRNDQDDLNNIMVITDDSRFIPVTELVSLKKSSGVQSLQRFNMYSAISMEVSPADGYSTGDAIKAIGEVAKTVLPRGYGYEYTGTALEEIKTTQNRTWVLLLVILFTYIVLAALFESPLMPLSILLSVTFGLTGSYLFALLFQVENNIYMQVGTIMLIGLLAKTAILLTEFATKRRKDGMDIKEAAMSAAKDRLRPVLMTVLTLVIGLLPMAFSQGALAVGSMSLAICVIGGMIVGTASILFFVPLFFMLFQHIEEKFLSKRVKSTAAVTLLAVCLNAPFLTSCKTYNSYQTATADADSLLRKEYARAIAGGDVKEWRQVFTDKHLAALIEEGLASNSDINMARQQVEGAKALLRNAKGELLPSVDIGAEAGASHFESSDAREDEATYTIGATVSWEADIFGKMKNARKAAAATVEEQQAYVQAVATELIATIATAYYQLSMLDAQIEDTRQVIESWEESIEAQKALKDVGQATSDDIDQSEANKLDAESTLAELTMQLQQAENALCAVLGRPSGHIERTGFDTLCQTLPDVSGFSIQSLTRRPDIRQAEAALKSAFYTTNEARAAFYPSLTLSGSIGWTNDAGEVVDPAGVLARALASLTAPVINRSSLKAELQKAKAEQESARIAFRQAILDAGKEVNDALASEQYARKAIELNRQQIEKLTRVVENSKVRMKYDEDFNYLQVLLARQSLLEARLALNSNRFLLLESTIEVYKALGGGN